MPTEAQGTEAGGSGEVMEQATETTSASVAVASAAHEPVDDSLDGGGKVREAVIKRFRQSVSDRVSQPDGVAVRPVTMLAARIRTASRDGAADEGRRVERVAQTVRNHGRERPR